jgi:hypothetical protein
MKKILYITLSVFALMLTGACQREGTIYDMPAGSAVVSFPSSDAIFDMLAEDGNKITVDLWRGNTKGAASVPVTIDNQTDGVFTPAKSTFDFADGEGVAHLDITYPDINAFGGEVYKLVLTVAEDQVSPSGIGKMTVKAQRKLTPKYLGTGKFYSDFWEDEWEQDIYNTIEAPNYYILPDCWAKGGDWTFTVSNGNPVWPAAFDSGYTYGSYGNVWIKPGESFVEEGVLYLVVSSYYLPSYYDYDFGSTYEAFTLPAGFSF